MCWSLLPLLPITSFVGQQARTWAGVAKTGGWEENYICKQGRVSVSKEVEGHWQSFWSSGSRAPFLGPGTLVMRMPDSDLSFLHAWFWYVAAQLNCYRLETVAALGRAHRNEQLFPVVADTGETRPIYPSWSGRPWIRQYTES